MLQSGFRSFCVSALLLAGLSSQAFAGVPVSEFLSSRAGRLIFGELIEGSLAANRILGTNVANPAHRMERMIETLTDVRMRPLAEDLNVRLNRIYKGFSERNPKLADRLFRGEMAEGVALELREADRRLIRELVTREFDRPFLDQLSAKSFRQVSEEFLAGESLSSPLRAMSAEERALVYWETRMNAAGLRSAEAVVLEHFEIPLDKVEADLAQRISPDLRDSLIFTKHGKKYVRWLINPEDTVHYKNVEKYLKKKGLDAKHYKLFVGHQTASRSYIVVDPSSESHVVFSAKVSTNNTGGMWRDKKQPFEDAAEARRAVDLVREAELLRPFDNIVTMDEPAMFGIRSIDQAMLVRVLGDLPAGEVTYLPGFSAVHEDMGVRIARANGSDDPAVFWNEHYNKPLARALAELAAKTGLTYDSPHSQNFLIEMIGVNPTGRIVLRDFGDTYALADFFEGTGRQKFLEHWEAGNIIKGTLSTGVGVLHGNEMPGWMTDGLYKKWGSDFYAAFEAELAAQTGVSLASLTKAPMTLQGRYFNKSYSTLSDDWKRYFERIHPENKSE